MRQNRQRTLAPDFSLTSLNGKTFRLSDFRDKVIVIDFIATWCEACILLMPELKVIWERYRDKIALVSIDIDYTESEEMLRAFTREFPYATWLWAKDTASVDKAYDVKLVPKIVIIDKDGHAIFTHEGTTSSTILIQEINQLLT